ncbi:Tripeptidyl-peptidase [Venturia nashicola]|uniref:Tripeptidyl-peptidase n=1 Tax=Venturia nashicola TaxID=86259 RepID=A0A4Z1NP48_9PEZI|nr:Tripeptidyl-peptidase [Venturia nashicola]
MYTIEQIIQALEALNATNVTNPTESYLSNLTHTGSEYAADLANLGSEYAHNLANTTSEYASQITKGGSPLLVYVPAAIALACVVAIVIYFCSPNHEEDAKKRKILERRQTGFFRPKRDESHVDRKPTRQLTRKLTKEESLKILEVLADATDEVTTVDRATGDQVDDKELPEVVAETVLKEHFGQDQGIDFSSSSSSDLSVDDAAEIIKSVKSDEEWDGDNESTPTASGHSHSGNAKDEETEREIERPEKPDHLFTTGGEAEQSEESDDERLRYLDEYIDHTPTDESIMSDDEGYTRPMGAGKRGDSGSPASYATAETSARPRRSSWHGEDQPLDASFEEELKAKRKPTLDLDFPEEEKLQAEAIPPPPTRRTTNPKKSDRPTFKKANSRVPTFGAEGIVPSRRTNTKKSEVSATAAMAEYADEGLAGEGEADVDGVLAAMVESR